MERSRACAYEVRFYIHRVVLFELHLKFWNTASIGIPTISLHKVDRLPTGLTAQQKGTTARWYSNKTSLVVGIQIDPLPCLPFLQVCGDVDYTCEIGQCSP